MTVVKILFLLILVFALIGNVVDGDGRGGGYPRCASFEGRPGTQENARCREGGNLIQWQDSRHFWEYTW